jgi:hypothetical protein
MVSLTPASINDSNDSAVLSNSNMPPNAFSSNLVGGKKLNRRKMRKIYKSYKKTHSRRGKTMKQKLLSLKDTVMNKLLNKSKKHKHHKHKRSHHQKRTQKGGNYDSAFVNRALASPNASLIGLFTSCPV